MDQRIGSVHQKGTAHQKTFPCGNIHWRCASGRRYILGSVRCALASEVSKSQKFISNPPKLCIHLLSSKCSYILSLNRVFHVWFMIFSSSRSNPSLSPYSISHHYKTFTSLHNQHPLSLFPTSLH